MGQKVHPFGFRLGVTEKHKSNWYSKYYNYAEHLKIDFLLRSHMVKILKKLGKKQKEEIADYSNIIIHHNDATNSLTLEIKVLAPNLNVRKTKNK